MIEFEFLSLPQIFFGRKQISKISSITKEYGQKALIVASDSVWKNNEIKSIFETELTAKDFSKTVFLSKGEPTTKSVDQGVERARTEKVEVVIAIGGGSALDLGKAIAGLVPNTGFAKDYMEVIGKGATIIEQPLPLIAIPTTAGTGTEVTKNAVILSREDKLKASIRSPLLIPKVAIIDPELMVSLPKEITASCGLDALTQLIEAFTSNKSQPITDSLAILGIQKATESLIRAFDEGNDLDAREDMAFASLLSGICLANAGLGAVHGLAGPIGGMFDATHGIVCGALLAPTIEQNILKLLSQVPFSHKLSKYVRLGEIVSEHPFETMREAVTNIIGYTRNITKILEIPKLAEFGISQSDFESIITKAKKSSSMRYNPVELSDEQLTKILLQAT